MIKFLKIINAYRIKFITDIRNTKKQVEWRLSNSHNMTVIGPNVKNPSLISVGEASYGILNVESYENPDEKLVIGDYVSIAGNVIFILGGNHQVNAFTTYPIKAQFYSQYAVEDAQTKGPIVVEDEVWIGNNVLIMSGVTIGKGSIIAAGSVVTKSVKPFSIVGGNPAKFIKFRIDEYLIKNRLNISLKDCDIKKLSKEKLQLFYLPLHDIDMDEITKKI